MTSSIPSWQPGESVGRFKYVTVRRSWWRWTRLLLRNLIPHREYLGGMDCVIAVGPIPKREYLTDGPLLQPGDDGYDEAPFEMTLSKYPLSFKVNVDPEAPIP